jgi:hypothetical protein
VDIYQSAQRIYLLVPLLDACAVAMVADIVNRIAESGSGHHVMREAKIGKMRDIGNRLSIGIGAL